MNPIQYVQQRRVRRKFADLERRTFALRSRLADLERDPSPAGAGIKRAANESRAIQQSIAELLTGPDAAVEAERGEQLEADIHAIRSAAARLKKKTPSR